ncbi:MAG: hypothetical protein HONDAALG_03300 [Gammaproteobacteria bacterium]|nr:hypothetical protein [Gammaproteobacteria bacterium]
MGRPTERQSGNDGFEAFLPGVGGDQIAEQK